MGLLEGLCGFLETLQERYPGTCGFMNLVPWQPYLDAVTEELPDGRDWDVLDVGAGRGACAPIFNPARYVGIDHSAGLVRYASRAHPGYRFREMDAAKMTFPEKSFDVAIMVGVLHHLPDSSADRALSEIRRVLRPSGRFVMLEPVPVRSRWNLLSRLIKSLDRGHFIRSQEAYGALVSSHFILRRNQHRRLGLNLNDCVILSAEGKPCAASPDSTA